MKQTLLQTGALASLVERPRLAPPTRHGLLRAMLLFRWLNLFWITGVFTWEVYLHNVVGSTQFPNAVAHPQIGYGLLGLALLVTAGLTELFQRNADLLLHPLALLTEIAVASVLLFLDDWVYGTAEHAQSLPSMWVVAVVIAVAIAGGQRSATVTGIGIGLCRYVGWLAFGDRDVDVGSLSRLASIFLLGMVGWIAGYALDKLSDAEDSITAFRAREEVARTLHDGVLQTLSVFQRRSEDSNLVDLARSQELELREYLYQGDHRSLSSERDSRGRLSEATPDADLGASLRATARKAEQRYEIRVDVVTAPDLDAPTPLAITAISGAVSEALSNAAKHGEASKVTIYAEPAEEHTVTVSVKDNGTGFDEATIVRGQGLTNSIQKRISEVGGRVEIEGRLGSGAEIRIWA